ncbi:diguanylate cyclase domain-containing protein [Desulfoluna butyratoxydans]|uniref:Nucleotide cyclase n=1 Tax=Desulfoluna butyratoxydans TaxID=231438 RepID=A0A4U8YLT8_9BACT|nr:diguanylate cyclase [Desulfoluna butyratoxydans]VFQ44547.1 nucleotide cyclase [Desulfoluna butyratoxydans]
MKKVFNVVIVGAREEEYRILETGLESARFETSLSISRAEVSAMQRLSGQTDLMIYCQGEEESEQCHVPVFVNKTIFVTSCYGRGILLEAFKKGAAYVLFRPLFRAELLPAIRNVLFFSKKYREANLTDASVLSFLRDVADGGAPVLEPLPSPFKPTGHFYPDVLKITGELENEEAYLEALAERGFFTKQLKNRVRLCEMCESYQINYREVCPACSSIDIVKGQMVHHFPCGHVDSIESFRQGADLVCPKCEETLRHIGIDYEKPTDYFKCAQCQTIVPEPVVELECLVCGLVCRPDETVEKNIYAYEMTQHAWEAVRSGQIKGVDLGTLLYDHHTNLYNKQFFEHELKRELIRTKRYHAPFTLILARIEKIEEIRKNHPDRLAWYVNNLFKALSQGLRELDTTCVWDAQTLGLILAETDFDGAVVVVNRIHEAIQKLEYLFDICRPEVSFSVVQGDASHQTVDDLIALAMADLADG